MTVKLDDKIVLNPQLPKAALDRIGAIISGDGASDLFGALLDAQSEPMRADGEKPVEKETKANEPSAPAPLTTPTASTPTTLSLTQSLLFVQPLPLARAQPLAAPSPSAQPQPLAAPLSSAQPQALAQLPTSVQPQSLAQPLSSAPGEEHAPEKSAEETSSEIESTVDFPKKLFDVKPVEAKIPRRPHANLDADGDFHVLPRPTETMSRAPETHPVAAKDSKAPLDEPALETPAPSDPPVRISLVSLETHLPLIISRAAIEVPWDAPAPDAATVGPSAPPPERSAQPLKIIAIDLEPAHLGALTVKMRLVDDRLVIEIKAASHDACEALRQTKDRLVERLTGSNATIDSLDIHLAAPAPAVPATSLVTPTQTDQTSSPAMSGDQPLQEQSRGRRSRHAHSDTRDNNDLEPSSGAGDRHRSDGVYL